MIPLYSIISLEGSILILQFSLEECMIDLMSCYLLLIQMIHFKFLVINVSEITTDSKRSNIEHY